MGVTKATTYSVVPVLYLNLDAYAQLKYGNQEFDQSNGPISLIATKEPKSDVKLIQSKDQTKLTALTFDDFVENLPGYSAEKLTLNAMVYFLFVVVAAIVGIFLYVMTLQKTALFWCIESTGSFYRLSRSFHRGTVIDRKYCWRFDCFCSQLFD